AGGSYGPVSGTIQDARPGKSKEYGKVRYNSKGASENGIRFPDADLWPDFLPDSAVPQEVTTGQSQQSHKNII
ncbi:MAG: hypothetical protein IJU01_00155, partial [Lachnospiraceae bacterium]|nr:hypothetical protein [Lachnospiraceae bacterium]